MTEHFLLIFFLEFTLWQRQPVVTITFQNKLTNLRFNLNVDHGRILTLCPIMDILCRVGWRLNIITSSSLMWRSTLYPNWRWRSLGLGWNLRSILSPLSLMMYLAPGYWLLPRRTSSCMLENQVENRSYSQLSLNGRFCKAYTSRRQKNAVNPCRPFFSHFTMT